jgi:hypothetical protein
MSLSGGRSQRCLVSRLLHRLLTSTCLGREKSAITPVDRLPISVPRAQGGNIARVPFGDSVDVAKVDRPFATQDQPFATACSPPVVVKAPSRAGWFGSHTDWTGAKSMLQRPANAETFQRGGSQPMSPILEGFHKGTA